MSHLEGSEAPDPPRGGAAPRQQELAATGQVYEDGVDDETYREDLDAACKLTVYEENGLFPPGAVEYHCFRIILHPSGSEIKRTIGGE